MLKVAVEDVELTFARKFQQPFAIVGGSVALQQIRVRDEFNGVVTFLPQFIVLGSSTLAADGLRIVS